MQQRVDKLVATLGYCSRAKVPGMISRGDISWADAARPESLRKDTKVRPEEILVHGLPVDPVAPIVVALHKPVGYVCSREEQGSQLIYELLPPRMYRRDPPLVPAGRLDKESEGLVILTDDGDLVHTITHPGQHLEKEYLATVADPWPAHAKEVFASGTMVLRNDPEPLLPVTFELLEPCTARLILHEGRYHQIRRMAGVLGTRITRLQRVRIGTWTLGDLQPGEWRFETM
jgi:16S rRNA pseudouridine516 synthase